MTKPHSFLVRFDIAARIIADGVIFTDDTALDMLKEFLAGARPSEIAAAVLVAPTTERISKEQGWPDYYPNQEADYRQELVDASPRAYADQHGGMRIVQQLERIRGLLANYGEIGAAGEITGIISTLDGTEALQEAE